MRERYTANPEGKQFQEIDIEDPEDARDFIREAMEKGQRPTVTVPVEYAEIARKGLKARSTWIDNLEIIAGTLGKEPYNFGKKERVVFQIDIEDPEQIEPRFTGPDAHFHGVLVLRGPIGPERLKEIGRII